MIDIRPCAIAELEAAPNLAELLAEYAAESSQPELGEGCVQVETYRAMAEKGLLHPVGAFDGDRLVGFILPNVVVLPHYGVPAAMVDSFFVSADYRKRGVGLRLLAMAERCARELGAKALILSAPVGGALEPVLRRRKGYRHSNEVFMRALA